MNFKNTIGQNMMIFILITMLINLSIQDCPISYYPQSTFVGSINANIDYSLSKIKQSQYSFNLVQPLTSNSPKVAIMLNNLSYRPQGAINFNIFYKPSPSFTKLLFTVNVTQQSKNKWESLKFSFFASQNPIFQLGSQTVYSITNTDTQTRKLISSKLPLDTSYDKPVLKIFLNGLSVSTNVTKQQVDQIRTQIQGYKSLSWSSSVVKYLQKRLNQRQLLQAHISNTVLQNRTLSFFVDLGYKQTLQFVSFSYVIFVTSQSLYRNQYIEGRLQFKFDTFINAPSLVHMDLFFIGIEGMRFKQWDLLSLNPTFTINKNQTFSFYNGFTTTSNIFNMTYFAISRAKDSYCSHCRDGSIVFQNFCINQCPQSYAKKFNTIVTYCQLCDIKQFKVPNKQKTDCVCAMQYFSVAIKDSKQFTCSACSYQCLTCQSQFKCLTCDSLYLNTFRVLDQQKSQCVCSPGYYDDGQNNIKCLKCHQSCLTCKGTTLFDCDTCPKGRVRGVDGNCICQSNFVDKNGACVCQSPNFNYRGYCFTFLSKNKCSDTQVQITINGTNKCECKPNYQRFKTICILCGQNQTVNQETGKCLCKQTFYKDEQKGLCLACTSGKIYNTELNKCICMKGTFETSDGRCLTCKRKQTLINNQCQCIYNYYRNAWGDCQKCELNSNRPECQVNLK